MKSISQILKEQPQQVLKGHHSNKTRMDGEKLRAIFLKRLTDRIHKSTFGKKTIQLNPEVENAIELVCQYLNKEVQFEENDNYSLHKGLFIHGNCGSGKTEILRVYQDLKKGLFKETVGFKTCKDMNEAYCFMDPYTNQVQKLLGLKEHLNKFDKIERIYDEFGAEEARIIDFGNKFSVMPHIFEARHAGSINGVITHSTSNLTRKKILDDYGARIDSRLEAMFNVIILGREINGFDFRKSTKKRT